MKLREEVDLRRVIRNMIQEAMGWESYEQGNDADNTALSTGYSAAYHQTNPDIEHLADLQKGGDNVISRRKRLRKK